MGSFVPSEGSRVLLEHSMILGKIPTGFLALALAQREVPVRPFSSPQLQPAFPGAAYQRALLRMGFQG